eukprot:UN00911
MVNYPYQNNINPNYQNTNMNPNYQYQNHQYNQNLMRFQQMCNGANLVNWYEINVNK